LVRPDISDLKITLSHEWEPKESRENMSTMHKPPVLLDGEN
jgi:hypothetical protein